MYHTQLQLQKLSHPWGGNRLTFANLQKELVGVTGPLLESGVYFLEGRTLVCADPLSGEPIWTRDGMPSGADVYGDGEWIFVAPPGGGRAQVFHALDGAEGAPRPAESLANRWATWGRYVLAWKVKTAGDAAPSQTSGNEADDEQLARLPRELWLYDAVSGTELWREQVPAGTRGTLVDCDEVALLQPDGRFVVRSLRGADVVLEARLNADDKLRSVYVLRSRDQYLVAANRGEEQPANNPPIQIRSIASGGEVPLVTGQLYAFQRSTGKASWPAPVPIERFGFPLDQPRETPVLLFLRQSTPATGQGPRREQTSVLCLDRRDGKPLLDKSEIPAQTNTFDVVADRRKQTVTIGLPTKAFVITLTDASSTPPPQEKPAADKPAEKPAGQQQAKQEKAAGF
jgi:hypothetical protein